MLAYILRAKYGLGAMQPGWSRQTFRLLIIVD